MRIASTLIAAGALALSAVPGTAQEPPLERLGRVSFPISCGAEVQGAFNLATAALHSFWYKEAIAAYSRIAEKHPGCAMAYWGIAMSYWNQIWAPPREAALDAGWAAVQKAKALTANERERDFIDAIAIFYQNSDRQDHRTRAAEYTRAMERVFQRHPNDPEAKAFYALALLASASALDKTYAAQKKAGELAESLFDANPDHPGAAHYVIHAFDYPELAPRARKAAAGYAKAAPYVPHALHMPSHIFVLLGLWEETIRSNQVAQEAERDRGVPEDRMHALDYMILAYLQRAQDVEAKVLLDLGREIEAGLVARKYETPFRARPFHVAAMPARVALERRSWHEAAALQPQQSRYPYADSVWHFARAIGLTRSGNPDQAAADVARLNELHQTLSKAKNEYWAVVVRSQALVAAGWVAHARGQIEEARRLMSEAARLEYSAATHDTLNPGPIGMTAHEALGELLLGLDKPAEALKAYETSLEHSPNRLHGLAGAGRAAAKSGAYEKAKAYFTQLVKLTEKASAERPEIAEAQAYLSRN
jgi:tetratricopeptide (TPR) repeat protein